MGLSGEYHVCTLSVPSSDFTFIFSCSKDKRLDFTPMDAFVSRVLATLHEDGKTAIKVFPSEAGVLLTYTERVAGDVVCLKASLAVGSFVCLTILYRSANIYPHCWCRHASWAPRFFFQLLPRALGRRGAW